MVGSSVFPDSQFENSGFETQNWISGIDFESDMISKEKEKEKKKEKEKQKEKEKEKGNSLNLIVHNVWISSWKQVWK